jgi:ABC-type transporter Mla subunit MlaD
LQQAGAAVDGAMLTLSMLDPNMDYDPNNSLEASLAEVGEGLEGLSGDLATIQASLEAVESDLSQVQTGVEDLGENLADIRASMENAAEEIDASVTQLNDLADRVDQAGQGPRRVITTVRWIASALLVWLGLSQLAPLHVGLSLIREKND